MTTPATPRTPREVADRYVDAVCDLDPIIATQLGTRPGDDRLPDLSPAGLAAEEALDRDDAGRARPRAGGGPGAGRRPDRAALRPAAARAARRRARRARGGRGLPVAEQPVQPGARDPAGLLDDADGDRRRTGRSSPAAWRACRRPTAATARPWRRAPGAACSSRRGRCARSSPSWTSGWPGRTSPASSPPAPRRCAPSSRPPARAADEAVAEIRDFLRDVYAPADRGDAGRGRPASATPLAVRRWTGSDLGAGRRARGGLRVGLGRAPADPGRAADRGRQGPSRRRPRWRPCAGSALNGPAVEGVEAIRERLQAMMDDAIAALDGTHFDLAEPVRRVEAMIAPPGSAAAPYYTRPAQDFSRPGRTWLPTLGRTRFPLWDLVSIWYHEGVPGHHLQLAQWAYVSAAAVDVPDVAGLGRRQRRGLGALRRAADGRARLLHRPRRAAGLPGRAAAAVGAGGHRHRHAPGAADPGRRRGRARRPPRASRGRRTSRGRSSARTPAPTSPSSTAS